MAVFRDVMEPLMDAERHLTLAIDALNKALEAQRREKMFAGASAVRDVRGMLERAKGEFTGLQPFLKTKLDAPAT